MEREMNWWDGIANKQMYISLWQGATLSDIGELSTMWSILRWWCVPELVLGIHHQSQQATATCNCKQVMYADRS